MVHAVSEEDVSSLVEGVGSSLVEAAENTYTSRAPEGVEADWVPIPFEVPDMQYEGSARRAMLCWEVTNMKMQAWMLV